MWATLEMCVELTFVVIEKKKSPSVMWLFNHPQEVTFAAGTSKYALYDVDHVCTIEKGWVGLIVAAIASDQFCRRLNQPRLACHIRDPRTGERKHMYQTHSSHFGRPPPHLSVLSQDLNPWLNHAYANSDI